MNLASIKFTLHYGVITNYNEPYILVPWFKDPLLTDIDGNTLVHLAARTGQTEIIRYFDGIKTNLHNLINKNGETPLHCAAANGNLSVFKILSKNSKDINPRTKHGSTPLHEACFNGHRLIFKYLISKVMQEIINCCS